MAKLIRFLSGRWTTRNARSADLNSRGGGGGGERGGGGHSTITNIARQTHQRSRSAERHGLLMCKVALLDGTDVVFDVPRRSVGAVLYEKVFHHLDLVETDYFGLQFRDELNINCWLNSAKSIRRQIQLEKKSHGDQMCVFRFRVKFYSSDPNNLKEEITRYQFFLQLRSDVESGRLHCPREAAVDLAALVLQAELGDFDESEHTLGLVSEFKFVPNQTEEMEIAIFKKFKTYRGLTPARCELIYLNKVKCLELYGVDFYAVLGKDDNQYQLGLMPAGILVCERSQKIGLFCWPKITKLQFKRKRLLLEVVESDDRGQEQEHTFIFRLDNDKACKVLWRCAVEHHSFFRLSSPIKPYGLKSDFFRLGSRIRYSGSTELQTVSKTVQHRDVKFQRRLSKRYSRREKFEKQEKEENNRKEKDSYAPTKRWSVAGTQDSTRKPRDLSAATTNQSRSTTDPLETQATMTRATDSRASMQRRRSKNYSSGRSPSKVADVESINVAKTAKLPGLVPVQVTVSMQESFEDGFEQRTLNASSSLRKSHRSVVPKESLLQPQSPPFSSLRSTSNGVYTNERSRQSIAAADAGYRSNAIGGETVNRPRQPFAVAPDKNHRHRTTSYSNNSSNNNRNHHQLANDSLPMVSYNSLHMPRERGRGCVGGRGGAGGREGGGAGGQYADPASKIQSQSYFPPRQTPHRLSMLPRQQEFLQFKGAYSEDVGHQLPSNQNAIVHYQDSSGRRNIHSVDNLYNGHHNQPQHFVSHRYVSYDEDRTLMFRPPVIHRTNLATQV